MNQLIFLSLLILSLPTFAQKAQPNVSATQSTMLEVDKVVNEGTSNHNGKVIHSLMLVYNGNINDFIKKLTKDFGRTPETTHEDMTIRNLVFKNIKNPEWTEKRLNIGFSSLSNSEKHIITVTCLDLKGNDYLIPATEVQAKIKEFFANRIQSK